MKDFLTFLKGHWLATIICTLIVLLAVIGVPLFINWTFTEPAWCNLLAVDWEAKDTLAYYGSALGFIGTVIFSGLALWQNHKIQEANTIHTQLLEKMERDQHRPIIFVLPSSSGGNSSGLKVNVVNASDNVALELQASDFTILDANGNEVWHKETSYSKSYLTTENRWELSWENPGVTCNSPQFIFMLKYCDKFNEEYTYRAIGTVPGQSGLPTFKLYGI